MPAPEFTLLTTGTAPKIATRHGLEAGINAVSQALFDQIGAISTGLKPAGNWDALSGAFPSGAERGTYYVVNVAGTVDDAAFAVGDWLIPLVDGAETGTYAGNWFRGDYSKVVPAKPDSAAAFEASSDVSRGPGALWETKDGYRYEEVTTGEDLSNAGGVKLKPIREIDGVTPAQLGAAGGGANDRDALVKWLDYLAANTSRVGYIDQDYNFATTITHDGDVTIRGPFSNKARLIYTGTGDGLELTGAVDLDGIIVDGNLPIVAIPTVTSEEGCLFGIHGPTVGTPGYLKGVKLGRVRAQNTRRRTGLALVNLQDFDVEHVRAERSYGHGLHFAGLKDGQIRGYSWYRVGNLGPEGTRLGSGLAFFIEDEPTKQPAEWYNADGVQSTNNVDVAPGGGLWATDTAWYCHNLNGGGTREFKNVTFGEITVGNAGKDGAKMRRVENVIVNGGSVNGAALRLFVVEESCINSGFRNATGQNAGQDTIGLWLDGSEGLRNFRPEGNAGYTNGEGQTLNKTPAGVLLDVDVSRFDAAPLIAFIAAKETNYGNETHGRIPR